jgi:hypothetical protein
MKSKTKVRLVPDVGQNGAISLVLNGKEEEVTERIRNVVRMVKEIAKR